MLKVACSACGARYSVPESAAGKKARCRKCGAMFTVAPPADDEGPLQLADLAALARGEAQHREAVPLDGPADAIAVPMAAYAPAIPDATGSPIAPIPGYLLAVAKSFLFPLRLSNLIIFLCACLCVGLQEFFGFAIRFGISCFFIIALAIVYGWYMSFLLRTVHEASANEDTLPELSGQGSWAEDIFLPLIGAILSWIAACVPFIVAAIALYVYDPTFGGVETLLGQILLLLFSKSFVYAFDPALGGGILLGVLSILALLLWPMFLLVVAIGGLPCLIRIDLIAIAIVRSLPGYLLMSIIAVAALILPPLVAGMILPAWDPTSKHYPPLGVQAAMACITVYFQIIAMRAIGLYYHYFKHRLAWDWG